MNADHSAEVGEHRIAAAGTTSLCRRPVGGASGIGARARRRAPAVLALVLALTAAVASTERLVRPPASQGSGARSPVASPRQVYEGLPVHFEANRGQVDPQVRFLARGSGLTLFLTDTGAVLAGRQDSGETAVVRMQLIGANPAPRIDGRQEAPGQVNYLRSADPRRWLTGIPTYQRVRYQGVYPGIDLVWRGDDARLEYDFVVAPEADPKAIRLGFDGATPSIDAAGDLVLPSASGELRHHRPRIYQQAASGRRPVDGRFVAHGPQTIGFQVGPYDTTRPLLIDPSLAYSSYLGGSDNDVARGLAVDAAGNAYVTGTTDSTDFPAPEPSALPGGGDLFVTKLDARGSPVYTTFLGGSSLDGAPDRYGDAPPTHPGGDIAVNERGAAYITGQTQSSDFPTTPGAIDETCGTDGACDGGPDAFVTVLDPAGSGLLYSTYAGGNGYDSGYGIAVGPGDTVYVAGTTTTGPQVNNDFPSTAGAVQETCGRDVAYGSCVDGFLMKIDPAVSGPTGLVYSTYLGGSQSDAFSTDVAADVVVDAAGHAYLTGPTASLDFPTTPDSVQPGLAGDGDAFLARIDPAGRGAQDLVYSTYLGGAEPFVGAFNGFADDAGWGVALGPDATVYVGGWTASGDFPVTPGAFQTSRPGCSDFGCDGFVAQLTPAGDGRSDLLYSTYLGTPGAADGVTAVAVDAAGAVWATGFTFSSAFPVKDPVQQMCGCFTSVATDAFASRIDPAGRGAGDLLFSTFLGGSGRDVGTAIEVHGEGAAHVAGFTDSPQTGDLFGPKATPFPTTPGAFQSSRAGETDAFASKIVLEPPVRKVDIDVMPGSERNPVQLGANRLLPVAILATDRFDPTEVDPRSVCFGDAGAPAQRDCTEAHGRGHVDDVDGDGDADLLLHFETAETGIDVGDTKACLTGSTYDDEAIRGCDAVTTSNR